ncbi:MAG: hypothetical protein KGY66_05235 [Candidatus Thermoplasmatota archaeon]|nr:hypothetical protein [Candidatus Thermoplasmatota archaeon]MBS3790302.1 hypothetical protein [Candidatus Thermoplasmatota archaeon]
MNEIRNNEKDDESILLIACYEKPYSEKSLRMIRGTIKRERPTKIIVLKVIEEPKMGDFVNTRIGKKTKEDFIDSVVDNKKKRVDEYTEDVLKITDEMEIPTEVRIRKGEVIADEIIEDYERMDIDHLIIHEGHRDLLDRLAKGEVEEDVKKEVDESQVTELE